MSNAGSSCTLFLDKAITGLLNCVSILACYDFGITDVIISEAEIAMRTSPLDKKLG